MPTTSARTLMLRFALAGLVALILVAAASAAISRRVGEREAVADARQVAVVSGRGVVAFALDDGLVDADPAAFARIDSAVRNFVLRGSLVRVKLWRNDGTIVYSDEPALVGSRFEFDDDERFVLETGEVAAEVSDLAKPENRFERVHGKLLEAYVPIATPSGEALLFEAYFRYDGVDAAGRRVWLSFAPVWLGALFLLELLQLPIAYSTARRLQRTQLQREQLLHHALAASDVERRRIAADLHDGVVQDLTGVSYSLAAAARRADATAERAVLEESSTRVREVVRSLRSLLVDIYPPNLADEGLESALSDLLGRIADGNLETTFVSTLETGVEVSPKVAGLLYRATQEALRNVTSHARASAVSVLLAGDSTSARVVVEDDGVGFEPHSLLDSHSDGHVGLRVLTDLVGEAGGTVSIESAIGAGTSVEVRVPTK